LTASFQPPQNCLAQQRLLWKTIAEGVRGPDEPLGKACLAIAVILIEDKVLAELRYHVGLHESDARDVLADAWIKVLRCRTSIDPTRNFRSFLMKVCERMGRDLQRGRPKTDVSFCPENPDVQKAEVTLSLSAVNDHSWDDSAKVTDHSVDGG
jgi:DNA-directed RNA polymerase specialized sigma24 family protein